MRSFLRSAIRTSLETLGSHHPYAPPFAGQKLFAFA